VLEKDSMEMYDSSMSKANDVKFGRGCLSMTALSGIAVSIVLIVFHAGIHVSIAAGMCFAGFLLLMVVCDGECDDESCPCVRTGSGTEEAAGDMEQGPESGQDPHEGV